MKNKNKTSIVIKNRKSSHNYEFLEKEVAGMSLLGSEVKSIRAGNASIGEAHCYIQDEECFITGMYIAEYKDSGTNGHSEPYRTRKLLLTKKQIRKWDKALKLKGLTIAPIKIFTMKGKLKIELALSKGKRNYDKRNSLKEKDQKRDADRALKE
jgi:SsrA-binding protein